jgi:hypothetical protein
MRSCSTVECVSMALLTGLTVGVQSQKEK